MTATIKMCMVGNNPQECLTGHPIKVDGWLLLLHKNPKGTRAHNNVWQITHFQSGRKFSGRMFATQQECVDHVRGATPNLSPKALAMAESWPALNDTKGVKFKAM